MPSNKIVVMVLALSALSGLAWAQVRGGAGLRGERAPRAETFERAPEQTRVGSGELMLPFASAPQTVRYSVINGRAILEEDIILGRVDASGALIAEPPPPDRRAHSGGLGTTSSPLTAINGGQWRWPEGYIPFEVPSTLSEAAMIRAAITDLDNLTYLTFRERTNEADYISFAYVNADQCGSSPIGRRGGRQVIELVEGRCNQARVEHEILHSVGAYHEQARSDRDQFVRVTIDDVIEGQRHNYDVRNGVDTGSYDFGSVMHYSRTSFGIEDNGVKRIVMTPVNPNATYDLQGRTCISPNNASPSVSAVMGQRNCLSASDIAGINRLYPFMPAFSGGTNWGAEYFATQIAMGDIDGDGVDEVAVARFANRNARVFVYDDANANYAELWQFGAEWGSGNYATSLAFGNVDADAAEELAITRRSDENARVWIVQRVASGAFEARPIGNSAQWGSGNYATDVAMGDIDGDGRDEIAVTRRTSSNQRFFVYDDAMASHVELASGGQSWGGGAYATAAAFGDVDGDGREELAIGRISDEGPRYFVFSYDVASPNLRQVRTGGENWGSDASVTDLSFGQFDADRGRELAIVRNANQNDRYFVFDDAARQFALMLSGGAGWGSGNYATGVSFGDADGDGREELAISRHAAQNERFWLIDDVAGGFVEIYSGGAQWGSDAYATSVALGDVNGDGCFDLGVTRAAPQNMRFSVASIGQCPARPRRPIDRVRDRVRSTR
jgi:hypothetical protein